jgi:hypothetical protein
MKVIYIAGKFRGPTPWAIEQNVRRAEERALEVNRLGGCVALCPHTNNRFFQDSLPDQVWLEGALELMRRCDAVMLVPGWETSSGTAHELEVARFRNIPAFVDLDDLEAWLRSEAPTGNNPA